MGVRGLMSFVDHQRRSFYLEEKLHDCNLVIDGFAIAYSLYFDDGIDSRYNGEFLSYAQNIEKFFFNLSECNIRPYVVFDGPIEQEKLPCVLQRLNERIMDVHKLIHNATSHGRLLPMFAVDTLQHYLRTNNIPTAITLVDADSEAVSVANYLQCPVLSQDSDYFIYNATAGYLPLSNFKWKEVWLDRRLQKKTIVCIKYHISRMYECFGVHDYMLPYLSVMLGNDWIQPTVFRSLVSSLPLPRSNYKGKKQKECDLRIGAVLNWLGSKRGNDDAAFNKLYSHLQRSKQEHLVGSVKTCLSLYRDSPDISETLRVLVSASFQWDCGKIIAYVFMQGILRDDRRSRIDNPHHLIQNIVRNGNAHPFCLNVLESNYNCLPVIVSDTDRPSPHDCAADVRVLIYRVLLRKYRFPMLGAELVYLQEYDKVRLTYAKSKSISVFTSQCVMCEQCHSLEQPCSIDAEFDIIRILRKINPKVTSFCDYAKKCHSFDVIEQIKTHLDIVMASTVIWIQITSPNPPSICSILAILSWSYCNVPTVQRRTHQHSLKGSKIKDYEQCESEFLDLFNVASDKTTAARKKNDVDISFLQSVAEWLCVVNAAVILHQVVDDPLTKFPMQNFVPSSRFLHEIHDRIEILPQNVTRDVISLSRHVAGRLQPSHDIKRLFDGFTAFVTSA